MKKKKTKEKSKFYDFITKNLCWACKNEVSFAHFCDYCVKIQPLEDKTDYFSFLGVEKRLNLDPHQLENRFHDFSRKFHPDYYQTKSKYERSLSLERMSILNMAYRTLKDPISRAEYMMDIEGLRIEKEKRGNPTALIEEMIDIQENLMELKEMKTEGSRGEVYRNLMNELKKARGSLHERIEKREASLFEVFVLWDGMFASGGGAPEVTHPKKKELANRMKDIIDEISYLKTVIHHITKEID